MTLLNATVPRGRTLPYAMVPHALTEDPRLKDIDVRVANRLVKYARDKVDCYPSVGRLARDLRKCDRTIQNALRRLKAAGWIRCVPAPELTTGRKFLLLWRLGGIPGPPLVREVAPLSLQEVAPKGTRVEWKKRHAMMFALGEAEERANVKTLVPEKTDTPLPESAEPSDTMAAALAPPPPLPREVPETVQEWPTSSLPASGGPMLTERSLTAPEPLLERPLVSGPPIPVRPLPDELKALPGADPKRVRSVAWRLAHFLGDQGSIGFFILVLTQVAARTAPVARLLAAYQAGAQGRGQAKRPGALFTWAWNGWMPPVRPSQINAPVYHQASVPTKTAVVPEAVPPDPPLEDLVADWRTWASQPRHPLSTYARKMLARVEGDETGGDADRAGTGP